ncbi:MAG: hypothetical protein OTJ97_03555 [SAR202 cluster bacterium]|nr:hypothetical protein [SAR202 cluster bacterium]
MTGLVLGSAYPIMHLPVVGPLTNLADAVILSAIVLIQIEAALRTLEDVDFQRELNFNAA